MAIADTDQSSPWHEGEKDLQRKVGVSEQMDEIGAQVIRPFMPDQHREFFTQLPFVVAGSVDKEDMPWATLIAGKPGFISSPKRTQLNLYAALDPQDPIASDLANGSAIGLLGIELHTRRRNRMNGHVSGLADTGFTVDVEHSFGNCPQYIQLRQFAFVRKVNDFSTDAAEEYTHLEEHLKERIQRADTFFVATYADVENSRQVDISHRGGKPGFVRVNEDGSLTIPDYAGNLFFNTLGNIVQNGKAGLVFTDFETGDMLHLTGEAEVVLDSPEVAAFQGAERLWVFKPSRVLLRPNALPLRWDFQDFSPNVLLTGSWDAAQKHLDAEKEKLAWRPFKVSKIVDESSVIKSFWLEPVDGKGTARPLAGQHLPIRLKTGGEDEFSLRTYTLSLAPSDSAYRISVKKDGAFSTWLHEKISVGDTVEARAPQGNFTIDHTVKRPVVMLAAGVGITPFAAMARHLVYEGARTRTMRPVWMFQAARELEERAFDTEFEKLIAQAGGNFRLVRVLSKTDEPDNVQKGIRGRISVELLKAVLPFNDYDFYLCGPPSFMDALYNDLRDMNIPDKRIFFEAFGPASVTRRPDGDAPDQNASPVAQEATPVTFSASNKDTTWEPDSGSLLELAEAAGLSPPFSCRMGSCGSCKTRVVNGKVSYASPPNFPLEDDEALICCAKPAAQNQVDAEKLILEL